MKKLAFALLAASCLVGPSAIAADLGRPIYKAPVSVAPMMWNGFYVGVNGGLAAGDVGANVTNLGFPASADLTSRGGFGGGQIGYNWQFSPNWVFGVEADYQGGSIEGSVGINVANALTARIGSETTSFGTARGRLGYAFGNMLLYGTGGFAFGRNTGFVEVNGTTIASATRNHTGWTAGGGVEVAFAPNWSAKVEYLYVDLGEKTYATFAGPAGPINLDLDHKFHTMRVGLNYRFGGGPVVAAY